METQRYTNAQKRFLLYSNGVSIAGIILGMLCILGWEFDLAYFRSIDSGYAEMKAGTAISVISLSIILKCLTHPKKGNWECSALIMAGSILVYATIINTFLSYVNHSVDLGRILEYNLTIPLQIQADLISAASLVCLILLIASVPFLYAKKHIAVAQVMIFIVILIAIVRLLGYIFKFSSFYKLIFFAPMDVPTTVILTALGIGFMFVHPDEGFMQILSSDLQGGKVARRLIPYAILVPVFLLLLRFSSNFYNFLPYGISIILITAAVIVASIISIISAAYRLNQVDTIRNEKDAYLRKSEELLRISQRIAHMGSWEFNISKQEATWSDETYRIFEVSKDKRLTYFILRALAPIESLKALLAVTNKAIITGEPFDIEVELFTAHRRIIYARVSGQAFYENNKIHKLTGFVQDITEKHILEDKVREKEANLSSMLENTDALVWSIDNKYRFITSNKKFEEAYFNSFVQSFETNRSILEVLNGGENYDLWKSLYDRALKGEFFSEEITTASSGFTQHIQCAFSPIIVKNQIVGATIYGIDVTNQRLNEQKMDEMSRLQNAILNYAGYAVISTDSMGIIESFNPTAEEMLGYKAHEAIGILSPWAFHQEGDAERWALQFKKELNLSYDIKPEMAFAIKAQMTRAVNIETTYIRKNGESFPVQLNVTALRNNQNEIRGYIAIVQDITEKKRSEEIIKNNESKLAALIDNTADPIWSIDCEYNLIIANEIFFNSVKAIYNLNLKINDNLKEKFETKLFKTWQAWYLRAFNGERFIVQSEVTYNDDTVFLDIAFNPIYNDNNEVIGAAIFGKDISHIKKFEKELIEAKEKAEHAADVKSQFLSTMSHEIRTPLNAVIGMTNLLLEEDPLSSQIEKLDTLKFSSETLLTLINDILDYNKIESSAINIEEIPFNIEELIKHLYHSFLYQAESKGIKLDLKLDKKINKLLIGDPSRISQIISNLIGNAIKFTEEGGVTISIKNGPLEYEYANLIFSIKDTGIGIPEEKINYVFELFTQASSETTRKFGGTGLGLAITKRLLELMNSEIKLVSKEGKGSEFSFCIKLRKYQGAQLNSLNSREPVNIPNLEGIRILIAEDNKTNRIVIEQFLSKWKASLDFVHNGIEAIEKISINDYHVVLMDLLMPEMDGYEATKKIRKMKGPKYQRLPIIALSASALSEVRNKVFNVGMNAYLTKPFNPTELYLTIVKCITKTDEFPQTTSLPEEMTTDGIVNFDKILEITGDNPEFLKEFLDVALESMEELLDNFEHHLQTFDLTGIKETKHKHTPLMEILNLVPLKTVFDDAKTLISVNNRDVTQVETLINRAKNYGNKIMNEMEERREEISVKI
ncbi:PAS domain-containing hybrid sensor histidine kinase/response regulator [Solitalea koreensis]|uniref:histidine kinase n=1 Tax=Solitalea koreensis TaxID=543615 RepID=A0A521CSC2_9SPHI|nr:PAS domain S-box protein [Solitalea koreensis]SMO62285.1 PAS domain S-box-containing protein [Solitalea koreensis]